MGAINIFLREIHIIGRETRERIVSANECSPLGEQGISLAGVTDAADGFCFVRPQPMFSQLLACVSGRGEVWLEDCWRPLAPDTALLMRAGIPHAYRAIPGQSWRLCWLHFPEDEGGWPVAPALLDMDGRLLEASIEGLYRETVGSGELLLLHHWASLVRVYAERAILNPGIDRRLRPLWETVDANLAYPWTLSALADRAGLSGEHLRRLCRKQVGRSPMQHVAHLRMRRAAALLSSGARTIESVAPQVGYENPFAFSTAFKRCWNLSPSQYRERAGSGGG